MNIVTVRYDLSPAMVEGTIRNKLIEMGWTPPPSAGELSCDGCCCRVPVDDTGCHYVQRPSGYRYRFKCVRPTRKQESNGEME